MAKKKKRRPGEKAPRAERRLLPLWMLLVQQLVLTGLVLCVFALFHHVLPRYIRHEVPALPAEVPFTAPLTVETARSRGEADSPPQQSEPERFSPVPLRTETSYTGPSLAFTVTSHEHEPGHPDMSYYVADVYVKSASQLRSALPGDGSLFADPLLLAQGAHALLAVNGDNAVGSVFSVRNGTLSKNAPNVPGDICVLYADGRMEILPEKGYDPEAVLAAEPWQVWCFGPGLLDAEGQPLTQFNVDRSLQVRHPRTAIGYYEPGHYCLVVIDGRSPDHSKGATLEETARIMAELGCRSAYNLDGGASSVMVWQDELLNQPSRDRLVADMIVLRELEEVHG